MIRACRCFLVLAIVTTPVLGFAQDAPSVVIVPSKGKGGPNLTPQIKKLIEKPLKGSFKLVPFTAYKKAIKKAGVKAKDMFKADSAAAIGKAAGVSHVLIVEGQLEVTKDGKKKKKAFFADVSLVECSTGDVSFTSRYALKGNKLTPQIATTLVSEVTDAINKAAKPAEPPPAPAGEQPPPPDAPPAPDAPPNPGTAEGTPPPTPEAGTDATAASAPTETPPAETPPAETPPAETPPTDVAALTPPPEGGAGTGLAVQEEFSGMRRKRWRPALHFDVGGAYMQRKGTMKADNGDPPGYEGPVPGGSVNMSFYPLALGGDGSWYEGIGIHAESQVYLVETEINPDTKETFKSTVEAGGGGLSIRVVFWDSATAPDIVLKGGYGIFYFPLSGAAYPGTRYAGPYAGGTLTIPFIEQVQLMLGGEYWPAITTSGKLALLGKNDKATGFRAEGGFRLFFDPFEILLLGRLEQYDSTYTGSTSTKLSAIQYDNVKLTDRFIGGVGMVGVAF